MRKFIIIFLVFLFSVGVRLWNLNTMGRTWDEQFYTQEGYTIINLITHRDFSSPLWIKNPDEPIVSKYFYGVGALLDYKGNDARGNPVFDYDLFYTRFISVLFGSAAVALVVLFGLQYFSLFTAVVGGVLFSVFPTYLGLTQRVTIESILVFFFTASVSVFISFLEKPSAKKAYLVGTLTGLSCIIKYSNVLLLLLCFFLWILHTTCRSGFAIRFKKVNLFFWFFIGFIQLIAIWPMPWLHIAYMISFEYGFRFSQHASPWEWFFGFPIHVPWIYYLVHFFIRTPLVLLLLGFWGIYVAGKQKKLDILCPSCMVFYSVSAIVLPFPYAWSPLHYTGICPVFVTSRSWFKEDY